MSVPLRVCVIGAGAGGLVALRHLTAQPSKFTATAFEQTASLGGTWVYTDSTERDAYGLPIHSSVYKYLKTNLPKEVMAFPDYPFREDLPSFMTHKQVCGYLQDYCEHFNLTKHINFLHQVIDIAPAGDDEEEEGRWKVQVQAVDKSAPVEHLRFDAVMVCNGHYSVPLIPDFPGMESFTGRVIHSHIYRDPEEFKDHSVLVIGGGASGTDIAMDLAPHAKEVLLLHRRDAPFSTILPENVSQATCGIETFTPNGVVLKDGRELAFNSVIHCTGYHYSFPFLSADCRLEKDEEHLSPLYKHLIHIQHPTLSFVGVPKTVCPFPMFDCQVRFVLAALDGSMPLPSKEEMQGDVDKEIKWRSCDLLLPKRHWHHMGQLQWGYNDELAKLASFSPIPRVVQKLYDFVHTYRVKELPFYKQREFRLVDDMEYREVTKADDKS